MSTTADRILDLIDAGLQHTSEASYGTDLHPDRCARCQRHEPADGDLCAGCRAFLLDDSDEDPTASRRPIERIVTVNITAAVGQSFREFAEAVNRFGEALRACGATEALMEEIAKHRAEMDSEVARRRRQHERQVLDRFRRSQRRTNRWGLRPGR